MVARPPATRPCLPLGRDTPVTTLLPRPDTTRDTRLLNITWGTTETQVELILTVSLICEQIIILNMWDRGASWVSI